MDIKEQIRDKKAELFDLQFLIGTLQAQLQTKLQELNHLLRPTPIPNTEEKNV